MKAYNKVASSNHPNNNHSLSSSEDNVIYWGGINIHPSLLNYDLNFVKVNKGEKRCIELRWNTRVMKHWDSSLLKHLEDGGMYGVQINNSKIIINNKEFYLLIIDFDNREFQDKVKHLFPETFSTSSGSKKNCVHLWFATDKLEKKFDIRDKDENVLGDILGKHGQVVAPGSVHPSGSTYRIVNDVPISFIPYDKVLEILKPYMKKAEKKVVAVVPKASYGVNSFYDEVRNKISIIDILRDLGIDTHKNKTSCPMHESRSGECFNFTDEVWNCWSCGKQGNLFTLVKEVYDLDSKETFEKLAELSGLEDEFKQHQINYMKERAC